MFELVVEMFKTSSFFKVCQARRMGPYELCCVAYHHDAYREVKLIKTFDEQ